MFQDHPNEPGITHIPEQQIKSRKDHLPEGDGPQDQARQRTDGNFAAGSHKLQDSSLIDAGNVLSHSP